MDKTDKEYIELMFNTMVRRRREGYYDKDASIMWYSEGDIRSIITKEWKGNDRIEFKSLEDRYDKVLDVLERSKMGTSDRVRGQRNFYKGLRTSGYLDDIEEDIGEKIQLDKLRATPDKKHTYIYDNEWIITFIGKDGYQETPVWNRIEG